MNEIVYKGVWWLPNDADDAAERLRQPTLNEPVRGVFRYSPHGYGVLVLERSLVGYKERNISGVRSHANKSESNLYPLILGESENGEYLSLHQCNGIDYLLGFYSEYQYNVALAFVSKDKLVDFAQTRISKVKVNYIYLADWLTPQSRWVGQPPTGYEPDTLPSKCQLLKAIKGMDRVSVVYSFDTQSSTVQEARAGASVTFEARQPLSFGVWNSKYLVPISDLLTLATNKPNYITSVYAYLEGGEAGELLYRTPGLSMEIEPEALDPSDMLFSLGDAAHQHGTMIDAFRRVVSKWIELSHSNLGGVYALLARSIYSDARDVTQFTNLVRAVEAYYKEMYPEKLAGSPQLKADKKTLISEIETYANSIPPPPTLSRYLQRLKGNIAQWDEIPNLSQRIKELTDIAGAIVAPLTAPFEGNYRGRGQSLRNVHAHGVGAELGSAQQELRLLVQALSYTFQALLLRDLGFPEEFRNVVFNRNAYYLYHANNAMHKRAIQVKRWVNDVLVVEDRFAVLGERSIKPASINLPISKASWSAHPFGTDRYSIGNPWYGPVTLTLGELNSIRAEGTWSLDDKAPVKWQALRTDVVIGGMLHVNEWQIKIETAANTPDLQYDIVGLRRIGLIIDGWLQFSPGIGASLRLTLGNIATTKPHAVNLYPHLAGWGTDDIYK